MNWELLRDAARRTESEAEQRYSGRYREYVAARDDTAWWSPAGPSASEAERLLEFVNRWGSRIKRGPDTVEALRRAGRVAAQALGELRRADLATVTLDAATTDAIGIAFEALATMPTKRAPTGAAKALHMMNRDLFVMCDRAISSGYQLKDTGHDYAAKFLPRMRSELEEALATYARDNPSMDDPSRALVRECCNAWERPLAKLVDEFNYFRFTQPKGDAVS
ncbi:MAG: hypothetical protein EXR63_03415 [Dehalococcoidia bacterium]|nr:hypothetical protein [Dehalococcoidia bacterium]